MIWFVWLQRVATNTLSRFKLFTKNHLRNILCICHLRNLYLRSHMSLQLIQAPLFLMQLTSIIILIVFLSFGIKVAIWLIELIVLIILVRYQVGLLIWLFLDGLIILVHLLLLSFNVLTSWLCLGVLIIYKIVFGALKLSFRIHRAISVLVRNATWLLNDFIFVIVLLNKVILLIIPSWSHF